MSGLQEQLSFQRLVGIVDYYKPQGMHLRKLYAVLVRRGKDGTDREHFLTESGFVFWFKNNWKTFGTLFICGVHVLRVESGQMTTRDNS